MALLFGAFIAGILTVLAPCVLPLLPVIIGGSVSGNAGDRRRPLLIAASLAISLTVFTVLLKATAALIAIPPQLLTYISGGIIIALGIISFFPLAYSSFMARIGVEGRAQSVLSVGATNKDSVWGPIIIGAALGPVFSSCSPVYAYILATVLPIDFSQALVYILAYVLGLSLILLIIGYYGQKAIRRVKFASRPGGWFQRTLAVIFIIVGILIVTGYDKKVQTWVSEHTPFNFDALSAKLIPGEKREIASGKAFNVTPYAAPEFSGLGPWINSEPLTLSSLKGKVVLVDFWTYSCINCIRNSPYLEKWYETYKDQGFVIVGAHAPEFAFEKVEANVRKGVKDQGITYPVALDNDFDTWNAFKNQYWPAGYLIDAKGMVRRVHYGEGEYAETEEAIRGLLQEKGADLSSEMTTTGSEQVPIGKDQTGETYLGSKRASGFMGQPALASAPQSTFTPSTNLKLDQWTLSGAWEVQENKITSRSDSSTLTFNIASKEAYVVANSDTPLSMGVSVDGKPVISGVNAGPDALNGTVSITEPRLYRLVSFPSFTSGYALTLTVPAGVELSVFTFGG